MYVFTILLLSKDVGEETKIYSRILRITINLHKIISSRA